MSLSLSDLIAPLRALPRRARPLVAFAHAEGVCVFADPGGPAARHAAGTDWVADYRGADLKILLSGSVTHHILLTDPALPLHDVESLRTWARHQFVHYHGAAAQGWTLAAWANGVQRGASAAHGVDLDALSRACTSAGVRLRAAHPWWAVALQSAAAADAAIATEPHAELWLAEGTHATRIVSRAGRVEAIGQHWLAEASGAALADLVAMRAEKSTPVRVLGYGLHDVEGVARVAQVLDRLDGDLPSPCWLGLRT